MSALVRKLKRKLKRKAKAEIHYQVKRKIYAAFGGGTLAAVVYFFIK